MASKVQILIADTESNCGFLAEVLSAYEVCQTQKLTEAKVFVRTRKFELIISDVHFDESRMVEFFHDSRSSDSLNKSTPFVAFRGKSADHCEMLRQSIAQLVKAFGLRSYIELEDYANLSESKKRERVRSLLQMELAREERQ